MSASVWERDKVATKWHGEWAILSYSRETYIAIFALIGRWIQLVSAIAATTTRAQS